MTNYAKFQKIQIMCQSPTPTLTPDPRPCPCPCPSTKPNNCQSSR